MLCPKLAGSAGLPCAKDAIPDPTDGSEGVVARLVALMMPIMVMWHLCKGEATLQGVRKVEVTAHSRVLLQRLQDAKDVGEPEHAPVQRQQDLRKSMTHNGVHEVVKPMVLVGVAREGVPSPMMEGVNVLPHEWHNMQSSMHPIHAERQRVVVADEAQGALIPWQNHLRCSWIVSRNGIVKANIECELAQQCHAVMSLNGLQFLHLPSAEIFLGLQRMVAWRLDSVLRESEEDGLTVGVVEPSHNGLCAEQSCQLLQRH
eukprot:6485082-Amphidinium_carterae.1